MKKSPIPLIKHIPDYLDWLDIERGLSSRTQKNYAAFLHRFSEWLKRKGMSDTKPHELTPEMLIAYRVYLARQTTSKRSGKQLKKATQGYYLIVLRSLLSYFAERDIVSLPADKVKLPRERGDGEVRFLNMEQLERLLVIPDITTRVGLRDRVILEVLFSTGLRISELVSLNRNQIESSLESDELELGIIGKGGKARTVYFSSRALSWLKKYLRARTDDDEALFINYRSRKNLSRRLTPRTIEKNTHRYAIQAGLPSNTTPHVLRHTFATDLLSKGVDIRVLQEFLGHRSIAATQIYAHVTSKQLRDIHRKYHSGYDKHITDNK